MSDYRNPNSDYRHPLRRDLRNDADAHSHYAAWGWTAGATILLLSVLAGAFDISFEPIQPPCRSLCSMKAPAIRTDQM